MTSDRNFLPEHSNVYDTMVGAKRPQPEPLQLRESFHPDVLAPDSGVSSLYHDTDGHKRVETLTYLVKTLLTQNTRLVEVAAKLEKESKVSYLMSALKDIFIFLYSIRGASFPS